MATAANYYRQIRYLLILGFCFGCLAGQMLGQNNRPDRPAVRDSAGIEIVINNSPAWGRGQEWQVENNPILDIGTMEGDPNHELHRVVDAARLSNGNVVVANSGTGELRFFDESGRFLFSGGGSGNGPGEFVNLWWIQLINDDTVVASDWRAMRISYFDTTGRYLDSRSLGPFAEAGEMPTAKAFFPDGTLLLTTEERRPTTEALTGVSRESDIYLKLDFDGFSIDTVGTLPGSQYFTRQWGRGTISRLPLAFGRYSQLVVSGDGFYFGASDTYEICYYSVEGTPLRIIRLINQNKRVTREEIASYQATLVEGWGSDKSMAETITEEMPYPEEKPAYGTIRVDVRGNLWVEDYVLGKDLPGNWKVFSPEGTYLGSVVIPARFTVFEIGDSYVLGKWQDEFDVEHVRMYRILKD